MCYKELDAVCSGINHYNVAWDFVEATYLDEFSDGLEQKFIELFGGLTCEKLREELVDRVGDWQVESIIPCDGYVNVRLAPPSPKITVGNPA